MFLCLHLQRLLRDCARLGIPFPGNALLESEIGSMCGPSSVGALKVMITRGVGVRGYRPPIKPEPTRVLLFEPKALRLSENNPVDSVGARVRICRYRLPVNPRLAGVKHANRLDQILARSEWSSARINEGLMLDLAGTLIEGTMSNVFLVRAGGLVTPELSRCGVAGIMRGVILSIAAGLGITVEVRRVARQELETADEVFLTNSLLGIWPVVAMGGHRWPVGSITRTLCARLSDQLSSERH